MRHHKTPFHTALPLAAALVVVAPTAALAQTEPAHPDPIVMMPDQLEWTATPDGAQGVRHFGMGGSS